MGKHLLTALCTALALGTAGASVAQASFNDSGEYHGGFKVGPLGQRFPAHARFFSFAYAPRWRHWHRHHYEYYR
jgi:hypothetical protein